MIRCLALLVSFALAVPCLAEVYSWRDENGVLHYGDLPGDENAEIVPIRVQRTDKNAVAARTAQQRENRAAASEEFANAQAEEAAADGAAQLSAEERAEACTKAREKLRNYINARRLYRTNEAGEREYLGSAEIDNARASAEQEVADKCR